MDNGTGEGQADLTLPLMSEREFEERLLKAMASPSFVMRLIHQVARSVERVGSKHRRQLADDIAQAIMLRRADDRATRTVR